MLAETDLSANPLQQQHDRPIEGAIMMIVTGLGIGGAEAVVLKLARGLVESGRKVIIVALSEEQGIRDIVDTTGLDIRVLGLRLNPLSLFSSVRQVLRMVREHNVSVVHAHLVHALYLGLLVKMRYRQIKLVFTSHSYSGYPFPRSLIVNATRAFRNADVLLGSGQHPGINASRSEIIPNGVTVEAHSPPRAAPLPGKPFIFLFLGRLAHEKNPEVLIHSALKMHRQLTQDGSGTHFEVWFAGDGPERERLHQLAASQPGCEVFRFLGMRSDVKSLYEQAHAFVLPSKWEGLPLAVLEAGASALPVIASPVGALPGLLAQDRGYLVEPEQLTQVMLDVLANYNQALERGVRLFEMVRNEYDERLCVERHAQLYRDLLVGSSASTD